MQLADEISYNQIDINDWLEKYLSLKPETAIFISIDGYRHRPPNAQYPRPTPIDEEL
jgi:hypothetical protein